MKKFQISYLLYSVVLDFLAIFSSFNLLYFLRQTQFLQNHIGLITSSSNFMPYDQFFVFVLKVCLLFFGVMFLIGGYSFSLKDRMKFHTPLIAKASLIWSSLTFLYFLLMRSVPFSRSIVIFSFLISFFAVLFLRFLLLKFKIKTASKKENKTRVLIISSDLDQFNNYCFELFKDPRYELTALVSNFKSKIDVSSFSDFEEFVKSLLKVDVIIDLDSKEHFLKTEILSFARFNQVEYSYVPGIYEFQKFNFEYDFEHNFSELTLVPSKLHGWKLVFKRIFDFVSSLVLLILLSPLMLVVSILIKLDSKGPVFFTKGDDNKPVYRIGQNKIPFVMYKFRTMAPNSHNMRYHELSENDIRKDSPMVKIKNDPRVTRLGKILRRFDIDELPQLINVLKGDMSLVGPRPHLKEEVLKYKDHHNFVFTIKPGITGLPQISGRSDLDFEDEIILDSKYIENWSFILDLKILLKTPFVVFLGHGEQADVAKK